MKLVILVSVCFLWALTSGEPCRSSSECKLTTCSGGAKPNCVNHICTCTTLCTSDQDLGRCHRSQDCHMRYDAGRIKCSCPRADLHCVDEECHCVHL